MGDAVHQLLPGATFAGRYAVDRCIGVGGMGSVYAVRHIETGGPCALKVMAPRLVHRPDMRQRFLQEAQVTARILSDHIVRVFDAGIDEPTGMPFIAMDLLAGEDLDATIGRRGPLPSGEVVMLLRQAALALDRTHAAGVVHRDLKPHNLFITWRDDGSPCLKILDFGIAKLIDHTGQRTRSAGTPMYMPPEQVRGDGSIGPAADVYALAHIAFTMLSGMPYWHREGNELGLQPFLEQVFAGPREPPSVRAAHRAVALPAAFDAWFSRAAHPVATERIVPPTQAIEQLAESLGFPPQSGAFAVADAMAPTVVPATLLEPIAITPASSTTAAVATEGGGSRRSPRGWLFGGLLVLLSVLAGSVITYVVTRPERTVTAEDRDDDEDDAKRRKRRPRRAECLFLRCKDVSWKRGAPFEALDLAKAAKKLARSLEEDAELTTISIGETVGGNVAEAERFSVVFLYRYPHPVKKGDWKGLAVMVNEHQMMLKRAQDTGLDAVSLPRCNTQGALQAAFAAGLDPKLPVNMSFSKVPTHPATWSISLASDAARVYFVAPDRCKVWSPYGMPVPSP